MATKAISVLCLLLCAQVFAVRNLETTVSRSLKQDTEEGATAIVSGTLTVDQPGVVRAFVSARGEAVAIARSALVAAFATAIAEVEGGGDALAIARVRAEAFGLAVAEALADTFITVQSTSPGANFCATAQSEAFATARAFAVVIVEVLAEASNDINFAQAQFAILAIAQATVSAYAVSETEVCGSGVFSAQAYTTIVSRALAVPFATVFALALALVTPNAAIANIVLEVETGVLRATTVTGFTAAEVIGNARANTGGGGGASNN